MRALLPLLLGGSLAVAPALFAQPLTVCILQTAPAADPSGKLSDAATLAETLSVGAGPHALTAIPLAGLAEKDMVAEAQKHACAWIVELHREQTTSTSTSSSSPSLNTGRSGAGSNVPFFITTTIAGRIEFTLRKTESTKILAHGSSSKPEWAVLFPAQILKKLPVQPSP